ncbi:MAG: KamA family radical SAM protein [Planctomycetota bacterium]|nr:KamA family radical SAM protein [Planctomycetota bacterium]
MGKDQWNNWRWQLQNSIKTLVQLEQYINLTDDEVAGVKHAESNFRMAITPYFLKLADPDNPNCPIRKQFIPTIQESYVSPADMLDPCGEDAHTPVPGLVHRYPDRVLLLVSDFCASYCRYCTRSRLVGNQTFMMTDALLERVAEYLESHKKIRDVLISGGDPLTMSTSRLEKIVARLHRIPNIEMLRIGTRVPILLPQRIDDELVEMLHKYHPFYMSIHFNHSKEITKEVRKACAKIADAGIPMGSQTVLLKGVNDRPTVMKKLMQDLLKIRVRPYYIYQCDPVVGTEHMRTSLSVGIRIMEKLRGHTTGYGVPTFVIDGPGGGGKIPVGPNYLMAAENGKVFLRNYQGRIFIYEEPPVAEPSLAQV